MKFIVINSYPMGCRRYTGGCTLVSRRYHCCNKAGSCSCSPSMVESLLFFDSITERPRVRAKRLNFFGPLRPVGGCATPLVRRLLSWRQGTSILGRNTQLEHWATEILDVFKIACDIVMGPTKGERWIALTKASLDKKFATEIENYKPISMYWFVNFKQRVRFCSEHDATLKCQKIFIGQHVLARQSKKLYSVGIEFMLINAQCNSMK